MSPFDKARYDALSKGLEISEVNFKEIVARWDAEFYTGKFARYCRLMKKRGCTNFGQEAKKVVKGAFDITAAEYRSRGVPFVRIANLKGMKIDSTDMAFIDAETHENYLASELNRGDILLSKTAYAAASIVTVDKCNSSQDTIAISLKSDSVLDSYFTVVYLNTKYGLFLMGHLFTGNIQSHFNLPDCKEKLLIPVFSENFQTIIHKRFEKALLAEEKARLLYREAESQLLAELGFANWTPSNGGVSVKTHSDFVSAGRLDAEYFQPKYDDYERHIKSYKGGFQSLGSLVKQNTTLCPKNLSNYQYVEIGDVNVGDAEYSVNRILTEDLPANAKIMAHKGDIIISKVRPNRGAVAIIRGGADDLVVSGAFSVVSATGNICKEALLVLLRTWVYRDWLLKWAVGSSYPVVKDEDVLGIPVPLIDENVQHDLTAKVQSSFALRAESNRLLDLAKRAVELAIEEGEHSAMEYIEKRRTPR